MKKSAKKVGKQAILNQAVEAWRDAEVQEEPLSAPARERILDAVKGGGETRLSYQTSLFLPFRRIALAIAAPAMILALTVGYLVVPPADTGGQSPAQVTNLDVLRQGEEIIFVIANGQSTHRVYKSSEISGLQTAEPVEISNGVYRDRIDQQADLVFYRID